MSQSNSEHETAGEAIALPLKRAYVRPEADEDWLSIAARVFPESKTDEAVEMLQSWNFHVLMRSGPQILPSDIIFVAPPEPSGAS